MLGASHREPRRGPFSGAGAAPRAWQCTQPYAVCWLTLPRCNLVALLVQSCPSLLQHSQGTDGVTCCDSQNWSWGCSPKPLRLLRGTTQLGKFGSGSGHWMGHFCNAIDGKHPLGRTRTAYALQHSLRPCEHPKLCPLHTAHPAALLLRWRLICIPPDGFSIVSSQPSLNSHPLLGINQPRTALPVDSTSGKGTRSCCSCCLPAR